MRGKIIRYPNIGFEGASGAGWGEGCHGRGLCPCLSDGSLSLLALLACPP